MPNIERETRDRLIDAARADVTFLAERQTDMEGALDRLSHQADGDADRLRAAAEQLRRRFAGAEAIPLLEAAASHVEQPGDRRPAARTEPAGSTDTGGPDRDPGTGGTFERQARW